jgi:histone acetyltransferase (RNA polymerase elongator complex component)
MASKRGHTAEDSVSAAKQVKEAGFKLVLQIMAGMPGSDTRKDLYTALKAASLKPDGVRIYPICVFPDTELYTMWEKGEYLTLTLDKAVSVTAKMLDIFDEAQIPVIRIGLNHSEDTASVVAAGPYHPAFGELAKSRQKFFRICEKVDNLEKIPDDLIVFASGGKVSQTVGHKLENINKLKEKYGFKSVKVTGNRPAAGVEYIEI